VNNFGCEDTSYVSEKYLRNLLLRGPYKAIPRLMNHIHFNADHPENQNLAITNKKSKYGVIWKDKAWQMTLITDIVGNVLSRKFNILDEFYNYFKDTLPKFKQERFEAFSKELDDGEGQQTFVEEQIYVAIINSTKSLGLKCH